MAVNGKCERKLTIPIRILCLIKLELNNPILTGKYEVLNNRLAHIYSSALFVVCMFTESRSQFLPDVFL